MSIERGEGPETGPEKTAGHELSDKGGYRPPPTPNDRDMSLVHHADSTRYNVAHARAHINEAFDHISALTDRMAKRPKYRPHSRALERR